MPLCKSCSDLLHSRSEALHDALTSSGVEVGRNGFSETLRCHRCGTTWTHFLTNAREDDSSPSWTVRRKRRTSLRGVARLLLRRRITVGMLMAIAVYESLN
jgi:hypothetical protein